MILIINHQNSKRNGGMKMHCKSKFCAGWLVLLIKEGWWILGLHEEGIYRWWLWGRRRFAWRILRILLSAYPIRSNYKLYNKAVNMMNYMSDVSWKVQFFATGHIRIKRFGIEISGEAFVKEQYAEVFLSYNRREKWKEGILSYSNL